MNTALELSDSASTATLKRAHPLPLYSQVKQSLHAKITAGTYRPHDRMPSESELMRMYGVSRITVRQALSELERENHIIKVPGKGSYVALPKASQPLNRLQGLAEAMSAQGYCTANRVISLHSVAASEIVAKRLQLAAGTQVTEIRRVRYLDRQPVSLDITYLRQAIGARLADEDLARRDIFSILEEDYGLAIGYADLSIDAVLADADIAEHLIIAPGAPVLRIERLTHLRDDMPIDFEYLYCRTDTFQYQLRIDRHRSA